MSKRRRRKPLRDRKGRFRVSRWNYARDGLCGVLCSAVILAAIFFGAYLVKAHAADLLLPR